MRNPTEQTLIAGFETSTLRVYNGSNGAYLNHKLVYVKTDFINHEDLFTVVCDEEKIVIKRFGFGYVGKTITPTYNKETNMWQLFCMSDFLPVGHYDFDEEESDTDNLVCYWSEQI